MAEKERAIVQYRPATENDVSGILWLIHLFWAENEHNPNGVTIGKDDITQGCFGQESYFKIILAELKSTPTSSIVPVTSSEEEQACSSSIGKDEKLVGYALYFFNFSTRKGRTLFMQDLFVRKEFRCKGYGTALMKECAKVAMECNCAWMEWQVLNWNKQAFSLYQKSGGEYLKDLLAMRMCKPNLLKLVSS